MGVNPPVGFLAGALLAYSLLAVGLSVALSSKNPDVDASLRLRH